MDIILPGFCLLLLLAHRDKWLCSRGFLISENSMYDTKLFDLKLVKSLKQKMRANFSTRLHQFKHQPLRNSLSHNIIFQKANVDMLWLIMFACSRLELYTELLMDWVLKNLQVETVTNLTFVEWRMLQNFMLKYLMPWKLYVDPKMTVGVDFMHDCHLHTVLLVSLHDRSFFLYGQRVC